MKITAVHLDRLSLELDPPFHAAWDPTPRRTFPATVVRVHTDEGLVGVGSGDTMDGFEAFEHLFVGSDPLAITRHVRTLETLSFHGGRFWPLEAALWDLAGQVHQVPVSVLFGAATARIPAYLSTGEAKTVEERVGTAWWAREQGFTAMKIRIGHADPLLGVRSVRAVREALGPDFAVMVDLNLGWRMAGDIAPGPDPSSVRRLVEELEELEVCWVEEPVPYDDLAGLLRLRASTRVPVAGGEMLPSFAEALRLWEHDALDVYQPDVVLALGMSRARTLAELAIHRNRAFTPHTWTNGIGLLANLHVAAGVGAGPFLEFPCDPDGWTPARRDFMLTEPVRVEPDGCVAVPDRPGLGVELDEDALARWRVG